jgi:glycosyltransferase involved in cell wall biosynthesis
MRFSVVVPVFNAEHSIRHALQSVLSQSIRPAEILVVDDGSTDRSAEASSAFEGVRILRQPNRGVSAARNVGIREARHEWIAFLDADDEFLPGKLEASVASLTSGAETSLVYSGFRWELSDRKVLDFVPPPPAELYGQLRFSCPLQTSAIVAARASLLELGGFDEHLAVAEDWDLWFRFSRRYSPRSMARITAPLVLYHHSPGSLSSKPLRQMEHYLRLLDERFLTDVRGVARFAYRRQGRARFLADAFIGLREAEAREDMTLLLRSLAEWPLPSSVVPWSRLRMLLLALSRSLRLRPRLSPPTLPSDAVSREDRRA